MLDQGVKVVDISADFRLKRADEYEEWYGVEHQKPSLLEEAVYGLTELHRDEIRQARLVANPWLLPHQRHPGPGPGGGGGHHQPGHNRQQPVRRFRRRAQPRDDQSLLGGE